MSGFSPEWLALREPADLAARNKDVLAACARAFAGRDHLNICDLGAGTGASVRALAHLLPPRQDWSLVDHDAGNLSVATSVLSAWADTVEEPRARIRKDGRALTLHTREMDLSKGWDGEAGLVTASALLDLVSGAWIDTFAATLAARNIPALIMLTVDGIMEATPTLPHDALVFAAFRLHQLGDKGFGPAAGPGAAFHVEQAFARVGYAVTAGDSPWVIGAESPALRDALLTGIAGAAQETGLAGTDDWLKARKAQTESLVIGHRDMFAKPKA